MAIKLNMGCGTHHKDGYTNADKYHPADIIVDLEAGEWPWGTSTVSEAIFHHSLEHMGQTPQAFFHIICELYRVCENGAKVLITAPHPKNDDFLNDPTHVRAITPQILVLFDKAENENWAKLGVPNTPLALQLGVNFKIKSCTAMVEERYKGYPEAALEEKVLTCNNIIKQFTLEWLVIK